MGTRALTFITLVFANLGLILLSRTWSRTHHCAELRVPIPAMEVVARRSAPAVAAEGGASRQPPPARPRTPLNRRDR